MDVVGILTAVAPQAGLGGILLALLVVALRNASTERGDYRAALTATNERHAAELAEVHARLDRSEQRAAELVAELDEERRKRWHAEDVAAQQVRREGNA